MNSACLSASPRHGPSPTSRRNGAHEEADLERKMYVLLFKHRLVKSPRCGFEIASLSTSFPGVLCNRAVLPHKEPIDITLAEEVGEVHHRKGIGTVAKATSRDVAMTASNGAHPPHQERTRI
jgi:hypothetical protein